MLKKLKMEDKMGKTIATVIVGIFLLSFNAPIYANDWGTAGKVLAGIEGMRLITGGRVDIIGSMAGINNNQSNYWTSSDHYCTNNRNCNRTWVSDYRWKKKYIPRHTAYDSELGEIIVESHYIEYKQERGGHWDYTCHHDHYYESSQCHRY